MALQLKNLNLSNASVQGLERVAVLASFAKGTVTIDKVKVTESVVSGGHWVGGLVGYSIGGTLSITNSSVENSTIGAFVYGFDANGDKVGGAVGEN